MLGAGSAHHIARRTAIAYGKEPIFYIYSNTHHIKNISKYCIGIEESELEFCEYYFKISTFVSPMNTKWSYCFSAKHLFLRVVLMLLVIFIHHGLIGKCDIRPHTAAYTLEADVLSSEVDCFNTSPNPIQSGKQPLSFPIEEKENEVKESVDDTDDAGKHLLSHHRRFICPLILSEVSFAQFEQNVLNKTSVSLVILHHSWRSFLS